MFVESTKGGVKQFIQNDQGQKLTVENYFQLSVGRLTDNTVVLSTKLLHVQL